MNVTKDGFKDRQLHIEDYLQMVSAEQKEYTEVFTHLRITEKITKSHQSFSLNFVDNLQKNMMRKRQSTMPKLPASARLKIGRAHV